MSPRRAIHGSGRALQGLSYSYSFPVIDDFPTVLRGLHQLLLEPNPDDPLIPAIAEQYRTDNAGFKKEALEQTKKVGAISTSCWYK